MMNISDVAKKTGLSAKAIRFYEDKKLITAPHRQDNGYRVYNAKNLDELHLLKQARDVGFTLEECSDLLALLNNPNRHASEVKAHTLQKVEAITAHIKQLEAMRARLMTLADSCPGGDSADCPIITELSGKGCCCHTSNS